MKKINLSFLVFLLLGLSMVITSCSPEAEEEEATTSDNELKAAYTLSATDADIFDVTSTEGNTFTISNKAKATGSPIYTFKFEDAEADANAVYAFLAAEDFETTETTLSGAIGDLTAEPPTGAAGYLTLITLALTSPFDGFGDDPTADVLGYGIAASNPAAGTDSEKIIVTLTPLQVASADDFPNEATDEQKAAASTAAAEVKTGKFYIAKFADAEAYGTVSFEAAKYLNPTDTDIYTGANDAENIEILTDYMNSLTTTYAEAGLLTEITINATLDLNAN